MTISKRLPAPENILQKILFHHSNGFSVSKAGFIQGFLFLISSIAYRNALSSLNLKLLLEDDSKGFIHSYY